MGYSLASDGKSITCDRCGMTSYNQNDIDARYCGRCKIFHDDEARWCEGGCGLVLVLIRGRLPRFCSKCHDLSGRP